MAQLDVYSDVICPWCYVGKQHMQAALRVLEADGLHFQVRWRPFQLNPDMPEGGVPREEYRRAKFGSLDRSRQLDAQVAEAGRAAGLEIRHDLMQRTPNTLDAHRLIRWAETEGEGAQNAVVDRLFAAYFAEGKDVGDRATLAALAAEAGLDHARAALFLGSDQFRAEVLAEDRAARKAGLDAVPTFALGRHVLFSGAVPPDVFAEALAKAHRVLGQAA
jgi:predicted DsbA family dithiol-disulfide isomerase